MSTTIDEQAAAETPLPVEWSCADLQEFLGGVPADRIRLFPHPGTATEADALRIHAREDRLFELVDGILVEKAMGAFESILAGVLIQHINNYLDEHPIGVALGEGGPLWILPTRMRIPDVSVILWERFPDRRLPDRAVYHVAPDLAVEVLSVSNTRREMELKRDEYLRAGVQLIWYIDPKQRTAVVYDVGGGTETIGEDGTLTGGNVLPDFAFRLRDLLDRFPVGPEESS